jgi:hypothetical protein
MKLLALLMLVLTSSVYADETCETSHGHFRITKNSSSFSGNGERVRVRYDDVRSVTRQNTTDFQRFISILKDSMQTDFVLSEKEAIRVGRFSLTVADDRLDLMSLIYLKAFDIDGYLIARFMFTEDGAWRCQ